MTNSNSKQEKLTKGKELCLKLKALIHDGTIHLEDIFEVLEGKEYPKANEKLKNRVKSSLDTIVEEKGAPAPSAGSIDLEDDENSRSEPFSDSEGETVDVLNEGIDELNYSTDRSIVTKENQHVERRVDPFNDKNKMIGRKKGNPQSRAPITMRPADPIEPLSQVMADEMNKVTYDDKSKTRKASLLKEGLTKEKLEPKLAKDDDLNLREKLRLEKEREEIDAFRRTLKDEEPNMINVVNGECSELWRDWFNKRMKQIEDWLLEDATIYSHLTPSRECNPPRNVDIPAADWNVLRKSEIQVPWDFEKYGPIMLTDEMAYDGTRLYDPLNGRHWSNIIEYLESQVKKNFEAAYPGSSFEVFEKNDGFFWSTILQQWYDTINVSTFKYSSKY